MISPILRGVRSLTNGLVWAMLFAICSLSNAYADGGVLLGTTTLLNSGDTLEKKNLVFLGDGFTLDEQDTYNTLVDQAIIEFLSVHPIHAMQSAFNVYRVNVSSPESGTDEFSQCGGEATGHIDVRRQTALDSGYCSGGTGDKYRCMLTSDSSLARGFAANAPADDIVIVLVNDPRNGGCAVPGLTFMTIEQGYENTFAHEMGHAAFRLADEYNYGGEDTFSDTDPGRVNITTVTDRANLNWADLVLTATPIPTQNHPDCSIKTLPPPIVDADIVGTFEGAYYHRCGIFRPQYIGRMRQSDQEFHAVSRRKIIRDLNPYVDRLSMVTFEEITVKNDHDGWGKGAGDIYINYKIGNQSSPQKRWPTSGTKGIHTGDTSTINILAGATISSLDNPPILTLKVRDSDWGKDDILRDDSTTNLPPGGRFEIIERDYSLRGKVIGPLYKVLFDTLNVKNDHDPFTRGDIYVKYTISNGKETVSGRWPKLFGDRSFDDHDTRHMNVLAGTIPIPNVGEQLSVNFKVMDNDLFSDDTLGNDTFLFDSSDNFGAGQVVHIRDQKNYRLTLSIIGPEPATEDPNGPIID